MIPLYIYDIIVRYIIGGKSRRMASHSIDLRCIAWYYWEFFIIYIIKVILRIVL